MTRHNQAVDPSPEEIARLCQQIQSEWSPEERQRRLRVDWRPTYVRADGIREELDVQTYEGHHAGNELILQQA